MKNVEINSEKMLEFCAKKLKIFGHPDRIKMLSFIKKGNVCVKDLWEYLGQPQPVISQHLAVLKEGGIVTSKVKANRRVYSIIDPFVSEIIPIVEAYSGNKK